MYINICREKGYKVKLIRNYISIKKILYIETEMYRKYI